MTAVLDTTARPTGAAHRIWSVVRLNTANPWTTITLPWMILGFIFVINWLIWWIINTAAGPEGMVEAVDGLQWSGASMFIFVYMMVVAIQSVNLTFALALGYGATRRDFWLGSALTFALLAVMYTVGLTILSVIEEATGGWGLGGRMFTAIYFGDSGWTGRAFAYLTLLALGFFFGAAIGAVYVRWKSLGVTVFFAVLSLLIVALVAYLTFTQSWPAVGEALVSLGLLGVYAWSYVITVLCAVVGFFILRRATPRS
ncbi:ABC transporter permease [Antiquaquibacter soli]|uniref:ABC transporter permease n=1 Tax=Antiquaquibacter soli TaxID=3064523 RepID=A0ABT9BKC6_9MICO|nr:ABC transporter permease [Protaetiibacter sp. WY-16]MDO7881473.1 ABC transporter permease [Protaetiibacter sp. WY-16]